MLRLARSDLLRRAVCAPLHRASVNLPSKLRQSSAGARHWLSTSSATSAANAELREVIEEEIRHEEEEVAEDFPDIAVIKEEEAPQGFQVVEEYNNALFHIVRDPVMEDPETTEPSVRVTVNINDREMEFAQDENGEENEEMEVLGALPFKVYICPQVYREELMEGLNAERSESAEDAALREADEAEERERSAHADALGLGGMLGDEEMEENSAPGLVLDCVCFADEEVDILSASIEPTDYEAGLMDMDEDVHKPYSPPEFQDLDERLQDALRATLEAYGVGDDTVAFLRDFVQLKEQTEYANYLKTIKDFTTNAEH